MKYEWWTHIYILNDSKVVKKRTEKQNQKVIGEIRVDSEYYYIYKLNSEEHIKYVRNTGIDREEIIRFFSKELQGDKNGRRSFL